MPRPHVVYCVVAGAGAISGGGAPPNQPPAQAMTSSTTTTATTAYHKRLSLGFITASRLAPPAVLPIIDCGFAVYIRASCDTTGAGEVAYPAGAGVSRTSA